MEDLDKLVLAIKLEGKEEKERKRKKKRKKGGKKGRRRKEGKRRGKEEKEQRKESKDEVWGSRTLGRSSMSLPRARSTISTTSTMRWGRASVVPNRRRALVH